MNIADICIAHPAPRRNIGIHFDQPHSAGNSWPSLRADLIMPVDESSHRSARESCPRCSTLTDYELFGNVTYPLIQNFKCENCSFGWANFYTELGGPLVG